MKEYYALVTVFVRADNQEQAKQIIGNVLEAGQVEGYDIMECDTEQFHCECCGHECYDNAEPTIVFHDKHTGNRYCSDCSIDYEETEDGRIILREQE